MGLEFCFYIRSQEKIKPDGLMLVSVDTRAHTSNHNGAIHRFPSVACAQKKKKIKQNKVMSIKLESTGVLYSCTLLEVFPAFNHLSLQCLALF